jgi:5-methylcytosine-specific restriction endonuclease McrA
MKKNLWDVNTPTIAFGLGKRKQKKKRVKLTPKERTYVWEHPSKYGRKCHICSGRITKQSDMELDHKRPYTKGGTKMNLAHRDCNRMKGSKSLKHVQSKMALGKKNKKAKTKKKKRSKRKPKNLFGIGPVRLPKLKL